MFRSDGVDGPKRCSGEEVNRDGTVCALRR